MRAAGQGEGRTGRCTACLAVLGPIMSPGLCLHPGDEERLDASQHQLFI